MSAADRIAETILQMGQIRARGLEQAANARAQAQAQTGQIWGGALAQLGQIPGEIAKYKLADTENNLRKQELETRQRYSQGEQDANWIYQGLMKPDENGVVNIDETTLPKLQAGMANAGVPLEIQDRAINSLKSINQSNQEFRQQQLAHQVKVAQNVMSSVTPDHPLTPGTALATLKMLQENGAATAQDVNKFMAAMNQGHDPADLFNAVIKYGTQPKEPIKLSDKDRLIDPTSLKTLVPAEPGEPKPTFANDNEMWVAAGDPNHPKHQQAVMALAAKKANEPDKAKDEYQTFKDAYAHKLLGPEGQWDKLTPDQQIAGNSAYTISKADPATRALAESNAQIRNLLLQSQLGNQPTKEDAALMAKQIIEHKMAPSQITLFGGMGAQGSQFKRMVGTEALKLDPTFDWEQAESDYQFGKTPGFQSTIRYIQSVGPDMDRLQKNANALANGDVRSVNALINAGKNQVNNVDLKKYQTDRLLVADVIAKILQGGGTGSGVSDSKLKQAGDILKDSDSPAATAAALGEALVLIGNREKTLTRGTYFERQAKPAETPAPARTALPPAPSGQRYVRDDKNQVRLAPAGAALPKGWKEGQ